MSNFFDGADSRVPLPLPVPVPVREPGLGSLVQAGANQLGHLGIHQFLGKQLQAVTEKVGVGSLLGLVEQVQ
jgi:hypothetical protein